MIKKIFNLFRRNKKITDEKEKEINRIQIEILQKEIEMAKRRITLLKYKRKWNGSFKYYFKKIASNGEVIFNSPAYITRSGRNKAVNKIAESEPSKIVSE